MVKLYIIWGITKYGQIYEFETEAEKNAFLYGIDESQGFDGWMICDDEEEYNQERKG